MSQETRDVVEEASLESFPASDAPAWTINGTPPVPARARARAREWSPGVLSKGLFAGLIGYGVVALFFALTSVAKGQSPFYIAALLGSDLFHGANGGPVMVEPGPVFAYNGVHMLAFVLAGLLLSWLAGVAGLAPQGWYIGVIAVVFGAGHVTALPLWFDARVQAELPLWLVVIGTSLAGLAMGAYLWVANPGIRAAMHEPDD